MRSTAIIRKISKAWKIWRKKVYTRDRYRCVLCGRGRRLVVPHHILPKRDFPNLRYAKSNGATLCWECHKKTFRKEYSYIKILVRKIFGSLKKWRLYKYYKRIKRC